MMNTQIIQQILDEELTRLMSDSSIDVWPTVISKWTARQRQHTRRKMIRRGLALTMLVLVLALMVSPQLRAAALSAFSQITGIADRPGEPVIFTPSPPFTVWQPGNFIDLNLVQTAYNPGFESPTSEVEKPAGVPPISDRNNLDELHTLFVDIDEAWNVNRAAILLVYRTETGSELWLYERAALPEEQLPFGEVISVNNHEATVIVQDQTLTLTWIADDTRIILRGPSIERQRLLELAESLVITSTPDTREAASASGVLVEMQRVTPDPTNASIWSSKPMLVLVPGQQFYGRLVVEVWTEQEHMFYPSDENGNLPTPDFFDRIIVALRDPEAEILTTTPWANDPVMGEIPDQSFLGRVVVEVWDGQAIVAITGSGSNDLLAQRAITRIEQVQQWRMNNSP